MVNAISTRYADCNFRSRLEARWAVFFRTLGIEFEYEKEGYRLKHGNYLPDFYLPHIPLWVEVKGQEPTENEKALAWDLFYAANTPVLLVWGQPDARQWLCLLQDTTDSGGGRWEWDECMWGVCHACGRRTLFTSPLRSDRVFVCADWSRWDACTCPCPDVQAPDVQDIDAQAYDEFLYACAAAKSARFEFGAEQMPPLPPRTDLAASPRPVGDLAGAL